MKNFIDICRPYGAEDLIRFGIYKDATPTAFVKKRYSNVRRSE